MFQIGTGGLVKALEMSTKELLLKAKVRSHKAVEKLPGSMSLTPNQFEILQRIYYWRREIARRTDRNPMKIIRDEDLVNLAKQDIKSVEQLDNFISSLRTPAFELRKQTRMLYVYFTNDKEKIKEKENKICHQCNMVGHLGFECVKPNDPQARKAFMDRPENKEKKKLQRIRKDRKYAENKAAREAKKN